MPGLKMQTTDLYSDGSSEGKASQQSLLSAMNRFVTAVNNMDDTVMIPSRLRDLPVDCMHEGKESNTQAVVPASHADLFTFYSMLKAVKSELVRGPGSESDTDGQEEAEDDDLSRQTARMFRHHLKGLFAVLSQLTDTAQKLTKRYQEEVGDYSTSSRITSFVWRSVMASAAQQPDCMQTGDLQYLSIQKGHVWP